MVYYGLYKITTQEIDEHSMSSDIPIFRLLTYFTLGGTLRFKT